MGKRLTSKETIEKKISNLGVEVADHVTAMLAYWDKDLVCQFANAAYLDWFGKKKEEMIGKITIMELLGSLFEKNLPFISAALKGEFQSFEREIPLPNGGVRHSLANYYPDIVNGEVLGFFVHVADVTQLKLLETELKKSVEIVTEQNKRLLNFSNIVSHNLKSYSSNLTSLLKFLDNTQSEDEKMELFEFLKRVSEGFSSTVHHLNEITKSQNLAKLPPVSINLREYIEKSIETISFQITSTNAIIINNVDTTINVLTNPAYTDSILLNLLTNAIKYRQPDKQPVVEFSSTYTNGKVILKVKDNGKGIDMQKHGGDIFQMYKTFHGNEDAEGIGLFITKYQVETMGGQIHVESEVNVGTTFTVSFNHT